MGLFDSKSKSITQIQNEQVALQGEGNLGLSNAAGANIGSITIRSGGSEAIESVRDVATEALRQNATAVNVAAITAIANKDIANRALDVANFAIVGGNKAVVESLDAVNRSQHFAANAVDYAGQVALSATPVQPGAYVEASGKEFTKQIAIAVVAGLILYLVSKGK
jgi:hypothetical protein